ncbi:hypothetical protein G6F46_003358 [Rhizopus delemar]|nr:hypothetical protein G6F43_008889 [Rhizopus delemar]KAG1545013.1 hypothetical protein G6F51_005710 [Rhizopus arrhizus]KAG1453235.1 hypothetical protein G6F55_008248 [Rhizopus delemar]KAG1492433.1 hypothetical protein G6F54_009315 [Rhizopus delemar]KAG1512447.1 hypothetical protein G6F53_005175 [Rhizopus delemar]
MTPPPYYTLLDPPLPPNLILSNVRINKSVKIDHQDQLDKLKGFVEFFRNQKTFWIEVAVLDRLYYKNLNQQRPFHRFKRSMELRKLIKRLKNLAVDKGLERLYLSFWNVKTLDKCTGNWTFIPSKESIEYSMHRIIGASLILDKLKVVLVETYRANSTLLKLEHFVSLALVYMGLCSRLYSLCQVWLNELEDCYYQLHQWSAAFPTGLKQKHVESFMNSNNLTCKEDTMKKARHTFAEQWMVSKSSIHHKVHLETYLANQAIMDKVKEIQLEVGIKTVDPIMGLNQDLDFEDLGEIIER